MIIKNAEQDLIYTFAELEEALGIKHSKIDYIWSETEQGMEDDIKANTILIHTTTGTKVNGQI